MVLEQPWAPKRMFWVFERGIFQIFADFWVTNLKPFSGKVRESVQKYLNQNLVIGNFLENGFGATLSSKMNVLSVWKSHFPVFCKFLSDEVEIIFLESDTKRSGLFKSDFGHSKLMRKSFWAVWSPKSNVMSVWKKHFSFFCKFLSDKVVSIIWQIEAKRSRLFNSNFCHGKLLRK